MAPSPGAHFQQVYDRYITGLSAKPRKKHFIGEIEAQSKAVSIDELRRSVEILIARCADRKLQRWLVRFLVPVATQIKEYSAALDQIITPQPAKIVWGGLRIVADCLVQYATALEKIESVLSALTDHLWSLATCDKLYAASVHSAPTVQHVVGRSYTHIIDLWYKITKEIKRHPLIGLGRQVWKDDKILNALSAIKEDADELHRISSIAEAELASHTRGTISEIKRDLDRHRASIDLETIAVREEHRLAEAHRRKMEVEVKALREKSYKIELDQRADRVYKLVESLREDTSHEADLLHNMTEGRYPGTCLWLFNTPEFYSWTSESCAKPVLWLHGKHGSGKSFICSAAVSETKGSPDALCTAYFFITKDREVSRTTLLRSLAYQLVKAVQTRFGNTSDDFVSLIQSSSMEPFHFEQIINRALMEVPFMCIFIDGMDEASDFSGLVNVVKFLKQQCRQHKGKLRLWLSSQYSLGIEDCVKRDSEGLITEFQIQEQHTASDIKKYLKHELPDSVQGAEALSKLIIAQSLSGEAKGSFLWVAQMIQDLRRRAESDADMLHLAKKGLPSSMHEYYKTIIARYRKRQTHGMPLWRTILSILAFARRPMRMHEIREAIAMTRIKPGHNIRTADLVFPDKIISECAELVSCLRSRDDSGNGTLVLSHLAVRNFLLSHAGSDADLCDYGDCMDLEPVVSEEILRDVCVRYLLQPRYSKLLRRNDTARFLSTDGSDLQEHKLVLYAVKYWYRHCGQAVPSDHVAASVAQFLNSTNFQTCLQVQSIAILGHFLINYSLVDGRPISMIQNLPTWISQYRKALEEQYNFFLREWCHVFQLGLTPQLSGQIDRVFWPGLGQHNFLRYGQCRYACFQLGDDQREASICKVLSSLQQGREQSICEVRRIGNMVNVNVEHWRIHSSGPRPLARKQHAIETGLDKLPPVRSLCAQRRSIIPKTESSTGSNTFKLMDNGKLLTIGAQVFRQATPSQDFAKIEVGDCGDFEEACQSDGLVVLCRRKRPKNNARNSDQDKRQDKKQARGTNPNQTRDDEDNMSRDDSEDDAAETSYDGPLADSDFDLLSDDNDSSENSTFDGRDPGSESDASDSLLSGSDDDSQSSGSELKANSDDDSSGSSMDSLESGSDVATSGYDTDFADDDPVKRDNVPFRYPVQIVYEQRHIHCRECNVHLDNHWFACTICEPQKGFNLCPDCIRNEQKWCHDKQHQMFDLIRKGPVGVISWDSSVSQQELRVFKLGNPEPIFTFFEKEQDMLHESPPCLHPSLPIVAWPVRQEKLLLADYSQNLHKVHKVRCFSRKARNIATSLNFSADGQRLHVAALEVIRVFNKNSKALTLTQNHYELSLTVTTLLLDPKSPCKRRPHVLSRQHRVIDIWRRPFFSQTPWTWTWTPSTLYLAINGLSLQLFKIDLSTAKGGIFVPSQVVFLPHSAQDRSVQYFEPQREGDPSLLMIGPSNGPEPQPPLAVYLAPADVEPWLNVRDVPVNYNKNYKLRKRSMAGLEQFDLDDDCIIVPFDLDY